MNPIFAIAAAAVTVTSAQTQAQQPLAFVTCPILRDTAAAPCWLAENKGKLYALEDPTAVASAPSLGHQALIEGMPTAETRCGGTVLTNLHISVRPDRDIDCNTILPATDAFPNADQSKASAQNEASAAGAAAAASAPEGAPPKVGSQRFEVPYDFDGQTAGRNTQVIADAAAYALANPKAEVHVTGFRAAVRLTAGGVLTEEESIGLRRARELVDTLATLGLDRNLIIVVDKSAPELGDYTSRRAFIDIVLGGGDEPNSEH